jgi:DNA uptake protein ComE-like DNA-binding protein
MKNILNAFSSFTRTERLGIITMVSLLLLFTFTRMGLKYVLQHDKNELLPDRFNQLWETQKQNTRPAPYALNSLIDINTADSTTLLGIDGIGPKLAHRILLRRKELGGFKNYTQVWQVYHFSESTKEAIRKRTRLQKNLN